MKKILVPAVALLVLTSLLSFGRVSISNPSTSRIAPHFEVAADLGRMPLVFVPRGGGEAGPAIYSAQGKTRSIAFGPQGLTFVLEGERGSGTVSAAAAGRSERWVVKLDFLGASSSARPEPREKTSTVVSYFKGAPAQWQSGLPAYSKILYSNLWPGIDLVYSGTQNKLKYDLVVHPGADPSRIRLAYRGADRVGLTSEGGLKVTTPLGFFEDGRPTGYQEAGGKRADVSVAYDLDKNPDSDARGRSYGFRIGDYDRTRTLVLDPFINIYSGFIGGSGDDIGFALAVDSSGAAYVAGYTVSLEDTFPVAVGPDLTQQGGTDAFVAKVNASGTGLSYCGYIGGSENDLALGVAVDSSGNAYVTGVTASSEASFPVHVGPSLTYQGGTAITLGDLTLSGDAFVAKVNAAGTSLVYCGYVGGTGTEVARGIAVNSLGQAYITGVTQSSETMGFPVKTGPDLTKNGPVDAFVAKVKADGSGLDYCGYIGGSNGDTWGQSLALDASGSAFVTGFTKATEASFPVNMGPDVTANGNYDAFVAKVKADGSGLDYCGYIGGTGDDKAYGIALDSQGCAYVTGSTTSAASSFPVSVGPSVVPGGGQDAFVAKVKADGSGLVYCGYIGGTQTETGTAIAVTNINGKPTAFITGGTNSNVTSEGFPVTFGPGTTYGGSGDAFLARVKTDGSALVYCGYVGGSGTEDGFGLFVDSQGTAYVCGRTKSTSDFPVAVGPDLSPNGLYDAFVAKISCGLVSPVLSVPANGAQQQPVNGIDFQWTDPNSAPQEGGYVLRLKYAGGTYTYYPDKPPYYPDLTEQSIGDSGHPFANNSTLYWNVMAKSANLDDFPDSAWANGGADYVFRTQGGALALFAPTLASPASGSTGQSTSLYLTWLDPNSNPQETNYRVRVKPAGGAYANFMAGKNAISYLLTGRATNKTYYWNVQAVGGGTVADSPWANGGVDWSFTTAGPVKLMPPVLVSPANAVTGQPLSVTLRWNDTNSTPQEVGYQVRVKPQGGTYTMFTSARDAVSYVKSNLRRNKTYLWNVRAKGDGKGVLTSVWANSGVDWKFITQQ